MCVCVYVSKREREGERDREWEKEEECDKRWTNWWYKLRASYKCEGGLTTTTDQGCRSPLFTHC